MLLVWVDAPSDGSVRQKLAVTSIMSLAAVGIAILITYITAHMKLCQDVTSVFDRIDTKLRERLARCRDRDCRVCS